MIGADLEDDGEFARADVQRAIAGTGPDRRTDTLRHVREPRGIGGPPVPEDLCGVPGRRLLRVGGTALVARASG